MGDNPEGQPFKVLFVCTGNICRSPIAERVGRAYLGEVLREDSHPFHLESAGTHAVVESGIHPDSARVLAELGGDPNGFIARSLTDDMALDADITLALTREHRRAVLKRAPRKLARTFTLLEAAELVSSVGGTVNVPGSDSAARCRALVKEMAAARAHRPTDARDDIADPIGGSLALHREVGEVIAESVVRLFRRFTQLCADDALRVRSVADRSFVS